MNALAERPAPTALKYAMPTIEIGTPILWYQDGMPQTKPFAGMVVNVGGRSIDVMVYAPNASSRFHMGVRHISDPDCSRPEAIEDRGAWDFTGEYLRLRRLELQVRDLLGELTPASIPEQ